MDESVYSISDINIAAQSRQTGESQYYAKCPVLCTSKHTQKEKQGHYNTLLCHTSLFCW